MQPNPETATAALELEHYFESGTYGHAAALATDSAAPVVEPAQHSNLAEREDARYVVTDLGTEYGSAVRTPADRRRDPAVRVMAQSSEGFARLIGRLIEAINRLTDVMQQSSEVHGTTIEGQILGGRSPALTRPPVEAVRRCNHRDGHELSLSAGEALAIEACRECPCYGARLWIGFPSVGAILEAATLDRVSNLPDLEVELTRRERQVLSVLHRSSYALCHGQLAALVWSDPDRTHEVRSVLYRLRRKLRDSGWAIPFPAKGNGVRLVPDPTSNRQPKYAGQQPDQGSEAILHKAA